MEPKEVFNRQTDWRRRALILQYYHLLYTNKYSHWKITSTAWKFDISLGKVSEDLKIARYADMIQTCSSRRQALKFIKDKGLK
jgi:hypothetical protein